ncbi:hypothetical protein [Bacillus infantis]|uniref:Uncharacterized protein n=1 Tax=Bacillus infantis TaxID=324767 RepID=A0A5D4R3Q4_9BACI|nr:hypothetical protein [Bacillus infantis]TYS45973.1 hypothetical protein FZD51_18200 [Bacillus infantis]
MKKKKLNLKKKIIHKPQSASEWLTAISGAGCLLLLIGSFILWGASELMEDFIWSQVLGSITAVSMCLCFGLALLAGVLAADSWPFKIFLLIFTVVFLSTGVYFVNEAHLLYKDRDAYENKEFEIVEGIPAGVEYDDPETGTEFVMELIFDDLIVDVYAMDISRSYYEERLEGRKLKIAYLPNSHYAVRWWNLDE